MTKVGWEDVHPSATPYFQSCWMSEFGNDLKIVWDWWIKEYALRIGPVLVPTKITNLFSGLSKEFRRYNSVSSVQKKKRKIPLDFKNQVPTRRRSVSCRDYSQASGIDLDGLERASSEHDIRSQCQNFSWIVIAVFALLLFLFFCCCCRCRCWRLRLPRYRVQNTICRRNIVTSQFQIY